MNGGIIQNKDNMDKFSFFNVRKKSQEKIFDFYLGGINGLVSNASEMENILNANVIVQNFETTSNDVRFDIVESQMSLNGNTFRNANDSSSWPYGNSLTYFIDTRDKFFFMRFIEFFGQDAIKVFQAEGLTNVGRRSLRFCNSVKEFNFPNVSNTVSDRSMDIILASRLYMPNLVDVSGNQSSNFVFADGKINANFYVNPILETINNGNLEPDLQQAINNYSANIFFNENTTKPSSSTSLVLADQGSGNYQVSFSFPNSNNTIYRYLLYLDDGTMDSKYNYYTELINNQIINITKTGNLSAWIIAEDIYGNRSARNEEVQLGLSSGIVKPINI